MQNKKTFLYILSSFVVGILVTVGYVHYFGTTLPLQGQGQSAEAFLSIDTDDFGDCGGSGYPSCNCTYRSSRGSLREGTVILRGNRYVCQSAYGWAGKNYQVF
jgi:hypothetical protein